VVVPVQAASVFRDQGFEQLVQDPTRIYQFRSITLGSFK
jgi:hypothetical protein